MTDCLAFVSVSRLTKTDMELEVLRYTNRISSEAHKMVRTSSAGQSTGGTTIDDENHDFPPVATRSTAAKIIFLVNCKTKFFGTLFSY